MAITAVIKSILRIRMVLIKTEKLTVTFNCWPVFILEMKNAPEIM